MRQQLDDYPFLDLTLEDDFRGISIFNDDFGKNFIREFFKKYKNVFVTDTFLFSLLLNELNTNYNIKEEILDKYIKELYFELSILHTLTYDELIDVTYVFNEYCHDIEYKEKILNYLFFRATKVKELIFLFHLSRQIFSNNIKLNKLEKNILFKIELELLDEIDFLYLAITYKLIGNNDKAESFSEKGFEYLKSLSNINEISEIITTFCKYFEDKCNISFFEKNWYGDFNNKLWEIKVKHKNFNMYKKIRDSLYQVL